MRLYLAVLHEGWRQYALRITSCIALLFLEVGVSTTVPYAFRWMLDISSEGYTFVFALVLLGNYCVLRFLKDILNNISDIVFFPVTNSAIRGLRLRVLQHVHRLSLEKRRELSFSDVVSAMRRVSHSTRIFFRVCVLQILPSIAKLAVVYAIFSQYGFIVVPFTLGVGGIVVTLMYALPKYQETRREAWKASDAFVKTATDCMLQDAHTRTNFTFVNYRLEQQADLEAHVWQQTNTMCNLLQIQISVAKLLLFVGVLGTGIFLILQGDLPQKELVILHGQVLAILVPLGNFMREIRQLAEAITDLEQVNHVLKIQQAPSYEVSRTQQPAAISLKDVSFEYARIPILENLTLNISLGRTTLLLGQNGSGKTTLMNVMAGVLTPMSGHISYNQEARVLYIPQDTTLYNDSLLFNITLDEQATETTHVQEILEQVGLGKLIGEPHQLQSKIGDLGLTLSGGQRARVWLARALYFKPNVLIMDETLDSIDKESRSEMIALIREKIETVVVSSHHDDIKQCADQIIDLDVNFAQRVNHASQASKINATN